MLRDASRGTDRVDLLIITDQKGSSSNPSQDLPEPTRRHFQRFVSLLKDYPSAHIIKNIGDSLMIRVTCSNPGTDVPKLLRDILRAQQELNTSISQKPVQLRVIVMLLAPGEFVYGKAIKYSHPDDVDKRKTHPKQNWLDGDLFGPNVALAFRASQIPTDPVLVVQEEVAALSSSYVESQPFSWKFDADSELHFGESLAFSPFKGLEALYSFAKKRGTWWKGHLFLRNVTDDAGKAKNNPIIRDQQKVRLFIRLVFSEEPTKADLDIWLPRVTEFEGNARYMRSVALVRKEVWYCKPAHPQLKQRATNTGMFIALAVPMESTYNLIRERIREIKKQQQQGHFLYPISTFVYETNEETETPFWPSEEDRPQWYVVVFSRWQEARRSESAEDFRNSLQVAVKNTACRIGRCGLLVGEEWDHYAYLVPRQSCITPLESFVQTFSKFGSDMLKLLARVFTSLRFSDDFMVLL